MPVGDNGFPLLAEDYFDDLLVTVEVDSSAVTGPDYKSEIIVRGRLAGVDAHFGGDGDDEAFLFALDGDLALSPRGAGLDPAGRY